MGLLDMGGAQPSQPQGGLLGGYQPQAQAQGGQGGAMAQMPPELLKAIAQIREASPEEQQAFMQKISAMIQSNVKDPAQAKQALEQIAQALQG